VKRGVPSLGFPGALGNVVQDLLKHAGLGVYVYDLETKRLYVNELYRDIYNHVLREPLLGETESLPLPETLESAIAEIKRTGKRRIRAERVNFAACTKHFRAHHFPIYRADKMVAVAGMYYDVTQQTVALDQAKESQTRFDDVIRSTSDWVWETDAEGRITFMSERITEALGYPPSTLSGRKLLEVGGFRDAHGKAVDGREVFDRSRPFRNMLFEIRDHEGKARRIHLSGVPVFDSESGRLTGYRGTGTDITARHLAEEAARRSKRDLEATLEELKNKNLELETALDKVLAANKVKGEFLAAMSHELRTPLNAIMGFAEVMLLNTFGDLPPKYVSYVKEIVDASKHLLTKINDILDVAKAENNGLTLSLEPSSLKGLIDTALSRVAMRAEEKRIDTSMVRVEDDWMLNVDPERTEQIFTNLLSNAIKFTTERGSVGLDVSPGDEGMLNITVWDTGIGIPPEKQDAIFESFHQIHNGIFSRTQEGTGIGLTVARHMAKLMGGDITLESAPGQGSRFTVTLPLAEQQQGDAS
jgi:PAS domain S-box-containing protein